METLRTPDHRFDVLPGFAHAAQYADVADGDGGPLRMAYVDAGPSDGPVVLLLHGEPTWSFLYRRVVDVLGLTDITLVGQDWGGLIGLRLVAEHPDRFARVVAANTGLPTGDFDMPEIWWQFRRAVESAPVLDIGRLVAAGCVHGLSDEDRAAYDAPFPDESYLAGPRAMPTLVPTRPDDPATPANRAAWEALGRWQKPFLVAFSDGDPITGGMGPILSAHVPGAQGREAPVLEGAGHFLQEDAGAQLGQLVADFVRTT